MSQCLFVIMCLCGLHIHILCTQHHNWAASWQKQQSDCAPSEDSDQPWHPPSLIRVFAQWVAKDPSFLHADSEDSDQTGRMPRLIWVFAGPTAILLVLSRGGSYWLSLVSLHAEDQAGHFVTGSNVRVRPCSREGPAATYQEKEKNDMQNDTIP